MNLPEGAGNTLKEDVGPGRTILGAEIVTCRSISCEVVFEIKTVDNASHFEALSFIVTVLQLPITM